MKIRKLKKRKTIVITGTADIADNIARVKINELIDRIEKLEEKVWEAEIKLRYIKFK